MLRSPAGISAEAGTRTFSGSELSSVTTAPPAGAGAGSATVKVKLWLMPSVPLGGVSSRLGRFLTRTLAAAVPNPGRLTVSVAPPSLPACTGRSVSCAPDGTVTVAGAVATPGTLLTASSVKPPAGAGEAIVTRILPASPGARSSTAGVS